MTLYIPGIQFLVWQDKTKKGLKNSTLYYVTYLLVDKFFKGYNNTQKIQIIL